MLTLPDHPQHKTLLYLSIAVLLISAAYLSQNYLQSKKIPTRAEEFPIQGFDVSHHQGNIAWHQISTQQYAFVYIKATEGGDFKDRNFQNNWLQAREHGLQVGAYHFYRLCRDGQTQAENFIASVPHKSDALPPAIDLEYDEKCINHYTKQQLLQQIQIMHDRLQQHYQKQPIFYVSKAFYNIVLADQSITAPLWVREYQGRPQLKNQTSWLFWQYSSQGKIKGIETAVDLNRFYGDQDDWQAFLKQHSTTAPHAATP